MTEAPQDPKLLRGLQETSQSVNASLHEGGVCLVDARAVQEAELLSWLHPPLDEPVRACGPRVTDEM